MIELIVLDVDGCLTDGKITYTEDAYETKSFNVKDGLAIKSWMLLGHHVAIITGRSSKIVQRRADELGITYLFQGVKNKDTVLENLLQELHLSFENVAAIGDDLNDYKMLQKVALAYTPHNGVKEVQNIAQRLTFNGGEGAVREMIENVLDKNGQRENFLNLWQ